MDPTTAEPSLRRAPANVEAEKALLGSILFDPSVYERLTDQLQPQHFYKPFHGRLFSAMLQHIGTGQPAQPIILCEQFKLDQEFHELGGPPYLAELVDGRGPSANAPELCRLIYDLALRRDLIKIGLDIVEAAESDLERGASDQIDSAETELRSLAWTGRRFPGFVSLTEALVGAVTIASRGVTRVGHLSGISTGLTDLDRMVGGLHPEELIILAGRPSMGKSALAINIALYVARNYAYVMQPDGTKRTSSGGVVAYYSLDMSAEQMGLRVLADAAGLPGYRLRDGDIDSSDVVTLRDAAAEIHGAPLYLDDTVGISVGELAARARRLKRTQGLELIVVDPVQRITAAADSKAADRDQDLSVITQELKALAKELSVTVLALSNIHPQVESREDRRPQMADLRRYGSIDQDADLVWFVYSESYYLSRFSPQDGTPEHLQWQDRMERIQNVAELIVSKQRYGAIGTVRLHFDHDLSRFSNLSR